MPTAECNYEIKICMGHKEALFEWSDQEVGLVVGVVTEVARGTTPANLVAGGG